MRITERGKYARDEKHRKLMSKIKKDYKPTEETKQKISKKIKDMYKYDEDYIKKCKETNYKKSMPGNKNPMYGKKRPDLTKRNKENPMCGEDNPSWLGGKSFEPYSLEFYRIRELILERDNFVCKLCKKQILTQTKKEFISVHHIDYDKLNNVSENLITLCNFCNSRVNFNRVVWMTKFKEVMQNGKKESDYCTIR